MRELPYAAWVTIQTGCDNSCSFCIVPSVRGAEVSRPMLRHRGRGRESGRRSGRSEVTLLGQNVNSYGRDLTRRRPLFADLLRAVGRVEGIGRVRFTSPHPKDLRPETIAAMAETPEVCEQLHLPLQSGSDRVLRAMRRGYTATRYLERLAAARAAVDDLAVTTDIIVGFPGETEDDFEQTLAVCAEAAYDSAFTFVFSPRPGTRAADMESEFVAPDVVAERFERLKTVIDRSALARHQARVGPQRRGARRRGEPPRRGHADRAHPPGQARPLPGATPTVPNQEHWPASPSSAGHPHHLTGRLDEVVGASAPPPAHPRRERVTAVALVGTTAAGKSGAALELARRRGDCDIVSVDSMCVYRGMDIGTSKPDAAARAAVPHHLLDLVDPDEEFTVSQFQAAARDALAAVAAAGRHALLVGGTGLYHRAVVDDLSIPGRYPDVRPRRWRPSSKRARPRRRISTPACAELDPVAAGRMAPTNRRRVVRALEVTLGAGRPFSDFGPGLEAYPAGGLAQVGLAVPPGEVDRRIAARFDAMVEAGLVEEVRALAARPRGLSRTARQALGYREILAHVEEGVPLGPCLEAAVRRTRQFARRQATWFRRDPRVRWADTVEEAQSLLECALSCTVERGGLRQWNRARHQARGRGQRLPRRPRPGGRATALGRAGAPAGRPAPRRGRRRHHPRRSGPRRLRPVHGAAQRRRLAGRDERERDALPGPGRGGRRAGVPAALHRRHRRGRPHRRLRPGPGPGRATASVDMGPVTLGPEQPDEQGGRRARTVGVGNPHLVLLGPDTASVDVAELGPKLQSGYDGGINVEWITVTEDDAGELLDFRVYERGAGETLACGTGSVAAAAAARAGGSWRRRARCGCAIPAGCSRSCSGRARAPRRTWRDRSARWPTSRSTPGCSLEQPVARHAHRALLPGADHPGRRGLPGPDDEIVEENLRRAGPAGRQRRRADVVGRVLQRRDAPDPATFVGRGKAEEIAELSAQLDADTVVFDDELTPAQHRNLEKLFGPHRHRPHRGDPRHLRPERPQPGRQGPGRAGPCCATGCPACAGRGTAAQPAGRRASAPGAPVRRSWRSTGGGWCAACTGWRPTCATSTAHAALQRQSAGPGPPARGGPGRLHQRRQVHPAQPADRRRRAGREPPVRHARPAHPPAGAARRRDGPASPTPSASCASCPTSWSRRSAPRWTRCTWSDLLVHVVDGVRSQRRGRRWRRCATVLAEIGAADVPELVVVNKADRAPDEAKASGRTACEGSVHRVGPDG